MSNKLTNLSIFAVLIAFSLAADNAASSTQMSLDQAFAEAREKSTFVLVDAYTTWCGPCKMFMKDFETKPEIREAVASIVFLSIDLEDSTSAEFNQDHPVSSVPQFILLDADGVEHGRFKGYGGVEYFLTGINQLLDDPLPINERLAQARADESWEGSDLLAQHHADRKEYEQAAPHFVEALKRGAPPEQRLQLLWAYLVGFGEGWATAADAKAVADEALANPAETDRFWYRLYNLMKQVAERANDDSLRRPYLERAVQEAEETDRLQKDPYLRFDHAHYVLGDHEAAAQARRDVLTDRRDLFSINRYAWYCFEHRLFLEDAEQVAREGLTIEGPPRQLAMLLDTLAELVHLKRDTTEAHQLIKRCIELDPENEYYQNQDKRFREILAKTEHAPESPAVK